MYSSVSVDGFVAGENDQPGPLFDTLSGAIDRSERLRPPCVADSHTLP
jgi:hypothetical protein